MVFWMVMAILNIIHQFITSIGMTAAFLIYPLIICGLGGEDNEYDYEDFGKSETELYGEMYGSSTYCSNSGMDVVDKFLWVYLTIGIMVRLSLCLAKNISSINVP